MEVVQGVVAMQPNRIKVAVFELFMDSGADGVGK